MQLNYVNWSEMSCVKKWLNRWMNQNYRMIWQEYFGPSFGRSSTIHCFTSTSYTDFLNSPCHSDCNISYNYIMFIIFFWQGYVEQIFLSSSVSLHPMLLVYTEVLPECFLWPSMSHISDSVCQSSAINEALSFCNINFLQN